MVPGLCWASGLLASGRHWAFQDVLLQLVEHSRVLFCEEGDGHPTLACSSRAANAVDVIWGMGRMSLSTAQIPRGSRV